MSRLISFFDRVRKNHKFGSCSSELDTSAYVDNKSKEDILDNYEKNGIVSNETSSEYWTRINVTGHHEFKNLDDSLNYLDWRNRLYSNYIECMPVSGADNKVVLDYGCGPGHDLVGFIHHSKPKRLIGMEVSPTSLAQAARRLNLHEGGDSVEFMQISESQISLPLENKSVDIVHSSGVLHHIRDIDRTLDELRRIIRDDGYAQVMIYNYYSVFVHVHVNYLMMLKNEEFAGLDFDQAFRRCTDGYQCPVSRCYSQKEFIDLVGRHGFRGEFIGAGVAVSEMQMLPQRIEALMDLNLPMESRRFIYELEFDSHGRPLYKGEIAGLDGCYRLYPI